jgi:hypothetical protein
MLGGPQRGAASGQLRRPGLGSTRRTFLAVGLLAAFAVLPTARAEDAPLKVAAEVLVVLASGDDGTVDASLSNVRALKHPPFNEYKTLKLLSREAVQLQRDQPAQVQLPNGRLLVLRLVAKLPDGRAKVQVSISRPNRKDYLPLLEVIASSGEPFFVAGQRYDGGTLVLGIRAGDGVKTAAR